MWACGIRNGDGGGWIVPLKAGSDSQVMTPYFGTTELGSIGMGAESSPFPLASRCANCVNHCIVVRVLLCKYHNSGITIPKLKGSFNNG